jgi:transposase-like protein
MDFPIEAYMDEGACYAKIVAVLHPGGLVCPRCGIGDRLKVHRRHRAPIIDYRCDACRRVFNAFTGTEFHKTHRRPSEILLILRGISQGTSTARLARELSRHRPHRLRLRHRLQARAMEAADSSPLAGDAEVEADEMDQNAGEKGILHPDPEDPPRRRANKRRGHGNFANDRPPVAGVAGRDSGRLRARVVKRTDRATLEAFVSDSARPGAMIYSDELSSYAHLKELGFGHATVCHVAHEWARDDDGDGIREVHDNTLEGIWTGLRNYLRIFRGVSKHYLAQYVAVFLWSYNIKAVTDGFLRVLMGTRAVTVLRT